MARVLIVDDEFSIRTSLGMFAENAGHEVSLASDAAEALEFLGKESFDVVVTDIILPRGTGVALLTDIRKLHPDVQVIMITGEPEVDTAAQAVRKGAFDYLSKPVSRDALSRVLAGAAAKKSLLDENRQLEEENRRHREHLEELVTEQTGRLRDSEERLRVLFERAPDAYYLSDLKGAFVNGNKAAERLTGYSKEELIGRSFLNLKLLSPKQLANAAALLAKNALGTDTGPDEFIITRKDGKQVPVEIRTHPVKIQGKTLVLGLARDITERKQAEERQEEHYKNVGLLSETAMRFVDFPADDDIYQYIGQQVRQLVGKSIVVVNSIDTTGKLVTNRAIFGLGKISTQVANLLGRDPKGMALAMHDRDLSYLSDGKLHDTKRSLYEILLKTVPKPICTALKQLYDIGKIYTMGFTRENRLFGTVVIFLHKGHVLAAPEIVEAFVQQASIALQRMHAEERTERLLDQQVSINELSLALGEERDLKSIYHTVYEHVSRMMDTQAFIISFFEAEQKLIRAEFLVDEGTITDVSHFPAIPLEEEGRGTQSQVIHTGEPVNLSNWVAAIEKTDTAYTFDEDGKITEGPPPEDSGKESTQSGLLVPMKIGGSVIGVMQVQSRTEDAYSRDEQDLLAGLANVTAIAISNARLLQEIGNALEGTVHIVGDTVEIRDPYTAGHQRRVTELACAIAKKLGLPESEIEGLRVAGLLHDVGKMSIPAEILSKPTRLTEIEFSLIQNHPQVAHDLLKSIHFQWPVAQIVLQHHERIDGSGYPHGLKGSEILHEARILAVCDVVEAMAAHRPYRAALGVSAALEEITKNKGSLYSEDVVDACLELFNEEGFSFEEQL